MKLLSILLLLSALLMADYDEREYEYHGRHLPMDLSYLNLDSEQHTRITKIIRDYREALKDFHYRERRTREAVARLFAAETFDTQKFTELNSDLRQNAIRIQAEFFSRIHGILTPKQKKRFIYYMEEWEIE